MVRLLLSTMTLSVLSFSAWSASPVENVALLQKLKDAHEQRQQRIQFYLKQHPDFPIEKRSYISDIVNGNPSFHGNRDSTQNELAGFDTVHQIHPELTGKGQKIHAVETGNPITPHPVLKNSDITLNTTASFERHASGVESIIVGQNFGTDPIPPVGAIPEVGVISSAVLNNNVDANTESLLIHQATGNLTENRSWGYHVGDISFAGVYSEISADIDELLHASPYLTLVSAAGNDAEKFEDGYFSVATDPTAKNVITVGALDRANILDSASGRGPTKDGRIKPDLVTVGRENGAGEDLSSTIVQGTSTSFAAPLVSSAVALVQQYAESTFKGSLTSASVKGLLIHTAKDVGTPGPDYKKGWGELDVAGAISLMDSIDYGLANIIEAEGSKEFTVPNNGTPLKVTLVWNDPKAEPQQVDLADSVLINDLDLKVVNEVGLAFFPWVLDPNKPDQPATTGINNRDNVEQILISPLGIDSSYSIQVSAPENQSYSLIISGLMPNLIGPISVESLNPLIQAENAEVISEFQIIGLYQKDVAFSLVHSDGHREPVIGEQIGLNRYRISYKNSPDLYAIEVIADYYRRDFDIRSKTTNQRPSTKPIITDIYKSKGVRRAVFSLIDADSLAKVDRVDIDGYQGNVNFGMIPNTDNFYVEIPDTIVDTTIDEKEITLVVTSSDSLDDNTEIYPIHIFNDVKIEWVNPIEDHFVSLNADNQLILQYKDGITVLGGEITFRKVSGQPYPIFGEVDFQKHQVIFTLNADIVETINYDVAPFLDIKAEVNGLEQSILPAPFIVRRS
ncbi:S8 family serine peptidase [Vibrio sp. NTOU-M3]|uniref:S8 family serine peptidase n=1 Tax=Vibrio sp. NTOU-M3 TaxID=3234954 RepID=UPI00349F7068